MLFRNRQPIIPHVYGDKEFAMKYIRKRINVAVHLYNVARADTIECILAIVNSFKHHYQTYTQKKQN